MTVTPRRLPSAPARSEVALDELDDFDRGMQRSINARRDQPGAPIPAYFGALLNCPTLASALMRMGTIARTRGESPGSYSHAQREWVDQVLSWDWRTNVVQVLHVADGLAVGVRLGAIEALRSGEEEELTEEEALLADHVRRVEAGTVTDDSYAAIEAHMGKRAALEYTVFIGFLIMTIRLHQALGVPDPPDSVIDEMLAEFRGGSRELPDASVRFH